MKYLKMIFVAFLFVFALCLVTTGSNHVSADDDDEKYENFQGGGEEEKEGPYEELGKTIGWGTITAMGTAGLIFPLRRSMKKVTTNYPGAKKRYITITKFFGNYHTIFGITALALGIVHGVTMYLSKGELEDEGIIGLVAIVFMVIAGILGAVLFKNKKSKTLKTTHSTLIAIAILIGMVHIFAS
jgi:hypothetical protein